jgi:Mrp family chromosome partitioning ATPase/uncharacterized protein involved in exopolysaccharide biosynthesis
MTIKDIYRILMRRWWIAALAALLVIGVYAVIQPKPSLEYEATGVVKLNFPRDLRLVPRIAQSSGKVVGSREINTWVSLLKSDDYLDTYIEKFRAAMKADVTESGTELDERETRLMSQGRAGIASRIKLESDQHSFRISLRVTGESERSAILLAQAVVDGAGDLDQEVLAHIKSRITESNEEVDRLQAERQQILDQNPSISDVLGTYHRLQSRIAAIEATQDSLRHEQIVAQQRKAKLEAERLTEELGEQMLLDNPDILPRGVTSSLLTTLRSQLSAVEQNIIDLKQRYHLRHPQLQEARKKADFIESQISTETRRVYLEWRDQEQRHLQERIDEISLEIATLSADKQDTQFREEKLRDPVRSIQNIDATIAAHITERQGWEAEQRKFLPRSASESNFFDTVERPSKHSLSTRDRAKKYPISMMILIALLVAGLAAYLAEFLDTSIKTDYDVRRYINLPLVGVVPNLKREELLLVNQARGTMTAEIFDTMSTLLHSRNQTPGPQSLVITSSNQAEGKTTVAVNLGIALANQGHRVVLVDCDLRIPNIHNLMQLPNASGFSNLLADPGAAPRRSDDSLVVVMGEGHAPRRKAEGEPMVGDSSLTPEDLFQGTPFDNLRVLTAGTGDRDPIKLLEPARVEAVNAMLRLHADYVIYDTPPLLHAGDALKLAGACDQVLMVIAAGSTNQREVSWVKHLLHGIDVETPGVVLNKAHDEQEQYYYYYGYGHRR